MRLLIDTNRYSAADRGDPGTIERFERATELVVSVVVLGELRYGFANGARREANEANLREFLATPSVRVLPTDEETSFYYASVYQAVKQRGQMIPLNDVWLAAQALQHNLVLDTADAHFTRIDELRLAE